jgi:hypothetical protein
MIVMPRITHRITQMTTLVIALAAVPAIATGQNNGNSSGQRGRYQEHDAATSTTFTATSDGNGNAVLTLKGGDFVLEKVVAHTGDATLRLSQGRDVVTIAINQSGFHVARGNKAARIDPRADKQDKLDNVRGILTGSQAVRSFKRLTGVLEQRDESVVDGPLALTALVDGAVVQLLDGDADAPLRIAKRISRKQRADVRLASARRLPGVMVDCIGLYQVSLMTAYGQFESCAIESTGYSWWSRDLVFELCSWEWAIRSYQYIWQFVGCFMLPW